MIKKGVRYTHRNWGGEFLLTPTAAGDCTIKIVAEPLRWDSFPGMADAWRDTKYLAMDVCEFYFHEINDVPQNN